MHNPEFTTCEFYAAHTNMEDLMSLTEELLQRACDKAERAVCGAVALGACVPTLFLFLLLAAPSQASARR